MVRSAADRVKPLLAGSRSRRPPRPALPRVRTRRGPDRSHSLAGILRAARRSRGCGVGRIRFRIRAGRDDPRKRRPDPEASGPAARGGARSSPRLPALRPRGARRVSPPIPLRFRRDRASLRDRDGTSGGRLRARVFRAGVPTRRTGRRTSPLAGRRAPARLRLSAGDRTPDAAPRLARAVLLSRSRLRFRLQAVEPLPAMDGTEGRPRLRPVARDSDEPARDPDGHARSPRCAPSRLDETQGGRLEDGARDHRPPRAFRPGGPGPLRLRPLPDRRRGDLPAGACTHPLRRVPARNRLLDRTAAAASNRACCHPADPPPSPPLSSRAERGICAPVDSDLPLRAGSARDLCLSRPQDRVA